MYTISYYDFLLNEDMYRRKKNFVRKKKFLSPSFPSEHETPQAVIPNKYFMGGL
jgi:hypothetical protein